MAKNYRVTLCYDGAIAYNINAENDDEARKKASTLFEKEAPDTIFENIQSQEIDVCEEITECLIKHYAPGETVKLGGKEYIILNHTNNNTTTIMAKDGNAIMKFGNSGNYETSDVRKFCNNDIYNELIKSIEPSNIVPHITHLMCDDGTKKDVYVEDNVSIITTNMYRQFRDIIPQNCEYWTATGTSENKLKVCCITKQGLIKHVGCKFTAHIRPIIVVKSDMPVDKPYQTPIFAQPINQTDNSTQSFPIREYIPFGDECEITKPNSVIDCSSLGYFDELEYNCMNLLTKYANRFDLDIRSINGDDIPISFDLAKRIEETIFDIFNDFGIKLNLLSDV